MFLETASARPLLSKVDGGSSDLVTVAFTLEGDSLPGVICELTDTLNITEFAVTMRKGRWEPLWGAYPGDEAPGGIAVYAPSSRNRLLQLVRVVSGMLCTSTGPATFAEKRAFLPRETVCTENLTPFVRLLPCRGSRGLAQLLTPATMFAAPYHRLDVNYARRKLRLTASYVRTGNGARSTLGVEQTCPLATTTVVHNDLESLAQQNITLVRSASANGQLEGRSETAILLRTCPGDNDVPIAFTEVLPPFLRTYAHAIDVHIDGTQMPREEMLRRLTYAPSESSTLPTIIRLDLDVRCGGNATVSTLFEKSFFHISSFPPDANRGLDVPAATVSTSSKVLYTDALLVDVPLPDFSMPYNVITLTSTVAAFFFGSVYNLLVRRKKKKTSAKKKKNGSTFGIRELFLFMLSCCLFTVADAAFSVAAYLPEWRYEGANWDVIASKTSHIILFSLEPSAQGDIIHTDRIPRKELMDEARTARDKHSAKLLMCFGGNGRSAGFPAMVASSASRARFIDELIKLLEVQQLDGVDLNWEYPGYDFRTGYNDATLQRDYDNFVKLLREMRTAFADRPWDITMSYYPDGKQERLLRASNAHLYVDLFHAMIYDQPGRHATYEFFSRVAIQSKSLMHSAAKVTLGVPFYGRSVKSGEWKSYEDIVQDFHPLDPSLDEVGDQYFNGFDTIKKKALKAMDGGFAGLMIWDVGMDCRLQETVHASGSSHVITCPNGADSSLLVAIERAIAERQHARGEL